MVLVPLAVLVPQVVRVLREALAALEVQVAPELQAAQAVLVHPEHPAHLEPLAGPLQVGMAPRLSSLPVPTET